MHPFNRHVYKSVFGVVRIQVNLRVVHDLLVKRRDGQRVVHYETSFLKVICCDIVCDALTLEYFRDVSPISHPCSFFIFAKPQERRKHRKHSLVLLPIMLPLIDVNVRLQVPIRVRCILQVRHIKLQIRDFVDLTEDRFVVMEQHVIF